MKRFFTGGVACVLALILSVSAFAMEVPTSTVVQNLNGVQQYIKTYTVPADLDPQGLIESPFEYEGYVYTFADVTKQENAFQAEKEHTETITVETKRNRFTPSQLIIPCDFPFEKTPRSKTSMITAFDLLKTSKDNARFMSSSPCENLKFTGREQGGRI